MGKADTRRAEIAEKLADFVLAYGLSAASVRPLAEAAGLSDRMLMYYFPDKTAVMAATLQVVAARMTAMLEAVIAPDPMPYDPLKERLARVVMDDQAWPFFALWLEVVAAAGRGDPLYRQVGEQLGRGFLDWVTAQLKSREKGVESARLFAAIEGMIVLKAVGLGVVAEASV